MPSPCSSRLCVVRCNRAAAVQALRLSPLALVAGESMKIEGASRRSAAPGSQKVGVAEYGDDVRTQPYAAMDPSAIGTYRGARLKPWHASVLPAKGKGCPAHSFVPLSSSSQWPERAAKPARTRRNAALSVQVCLVAHCAILRHNSQSRQVPPSLFPCSESPSRVPMPAVLRTAANPSLNLTHSGLRPPRAS
jgi:hypothetical protein